MQRRSALVTGITGQDGSYLADLIVRQGLRRPRPCAPHERAQHPANTAPIDDESIADASPCISGIWLMLIRCDI